MAQTTITTRATTTKATTTTTLPATTTTMSLPGIGHPARDGKFEFVVTGVEQPGQTFSPGNLLDDTALGT